MKKIFTLISGMVLFSFLALSVSAQTNEAKTGNVTTADLISNIVPNTYIIDTLEAAGSYYFDKLKYTLVSVPEYLLGQKFISPANADKRAGSIAFTLGQQADVYIAMDQRAVTALTWVNSMGFTKKAGDNITSTDLECIFDIYKKSYSPQTIELGPNDTLGKNSMYFVVVIPTGNNFSTISLNNSISCFPNPATSCFSIKLKDNVTSSIEIYDIFGRSVYNAVEAKSIHIINEHNFKSGVYLVKVTDSNNNVDVQRIIIE